MYGVTDTLTVGFTLPYYWQKNRVKARLESSQATVGKKCQPEHAGPIDRTRDGPIEYK